jgi:Spy/CpxP family protein refolding chaperone
MLRSILSLCLGLSLAGAGLAWAQPGGHEFGRGGFQDRFLQVKRTQLGPALGVNQQTVDKLLAIDARYRPLRHQLVVGMRNDMHRLQQLMRQPNPPEQDVRATLADMKRKRLEMLNLQQRKDDEESAILTPMQQARYIMYLMALIKEARSVKRGAGHEQPGVVRQPGGLGSPGGLPVPTLRPTEIPVSRPPR